MNGDVVVSGQLDHLVVWNHERFVPRLAGTALHGRGLPCPQRAGNLSGTPGGGGRPGRWTPQHCARPGRGDPRSCWRPERGGLFVDATARPGRACRGAARGLAGGPARRRRPRPAGARARRAAPGARSATGCAWCTRDFHRPRRRPSPASAIENRWASRASWPISAFRRCSSTRRSGASASGSTGRSTCGWESRDLTAADLVNETSEGELERIIREYGEERQARRIARAIASARQQKPIETTGAAQAPDRPGQEAPAAAEREEKIDPGDARVPGPAHRGQRGAGRAWRASSSRRSTCWMPTAGWWSSPTTAWKTASSRTRLRDPGRGRDRPGHRPLALREPAHRGADQEAGAADRGRGGGQPPFPLGPPAGRRKLPEVKILRVDRR